MVDTQSNPPTNKYNGKMTKPTAYDYNIDTLIYFTMSSPSPIKDGEIDEISHVFAFQLSTLINPPIMVPWNEILYDIASEQR